MSRFTSITKPERTEAHLMVRYVIVVLGAALIVGAPARVMADDFWPPWWRGQPLSVMAEWEFAGEWEYWPSVSIYPEIVDFYGEGEHSYLPTHIHGYDVFWEEDPNEPGDGRAYSDPNSGGYFEIVMDNWYDDEPYKYFWIQMTYGGDTPSVYAIEGEPNGYAYFPLDVIHVDENHVVESWVIEPNPDWEWIWIDIPAGTWVDQLLIDTISIPEPATLSLLALGGLLVTRRRR